MSQQTQISKQPQCNRNARPAISHIVHRIESKQSYRNRSSILCTLLLLIWAYRVSRVWVCAATPIKTAHCQSRLRIHAYACPHARTIRQICVERETITFTVRCMAPGGQKFLERLFVFCLPLSAARRVGQQNRAHTVRRHVRQRIRSGKFVDDKW